MNRQDVKNAKEQAKGMQSRSAKMDIGPGLLRPTRNRATPLVSSNYVELLEDIKGRIRRAQMQALSAANQELLLLYYSIGLDLHLRARRGTWGTAVIDRLALDLHREFPDLHGFSPRNLRRMRAFYRAYPLSAVGIRNRPPAVAKVILEKWPRAVAKLPWAHNVILVEKCKNRTEREWYAQSALENGWSRDILALHIETRLFQRQGKAVSNFRRALPSPQSDLAQQMTRDPYKFDFLTLADDFREKELENGLIRHVEQFLVELGLGFAFVGRQVHLNVGDEDYYLDLLFYHYRLHRFVVIELKEGAFRPEYSGKMNFYLSAVDDLLRKPGDNPSVGLILCRARNRVTAEYALRDVHKPIGVAGWETRLVESLPKRLKGQLPTVAEIEAELLRVPKPRTR
ncbi:MAG: PDDEXK nuclease domain-containing protein [candidate division WOR-3 bacterium]|nr:PDDEXK nuclease domain-containing protein [candidate division WOR-3 bacterium]